MVLPKDFANFQRLVFIINKVFGSTCIVTDLRELVRVRHLLHLYMKDKIVEIRVFEAR